MHGANQRSFTRCQFENRGVVVAYDFMFVHQDVYLYDETWTKTNF